MKSASWLAVILWALCVTYASFFVTRGWIPHDEGTIAQSAERVMHGEMPHRDFDDLYTGGLSYLHAAGMKVLGVNLVTPRQLLLVAFLMFLAAAYAVARRIASGPAALLAMPLVTAWSVPNYFVSLPSWYNLVFATVGIWALMRYLDSEYRIWLLLAGVCGGLSLLAKITGAYYALAALIFLGYVAQLQAVSDTSPRRSWVFVVWLAPVLCIALLLAQESTLQAALAFAPLFLAPVLICGFAAWCEWTTPGEAAPRFARLLSLVWPFAAGIMLVVVPFLLMYWRAHALEDLLYGVFIQPRMRLTQASIPPPALVTMGLAIPYLVLLQLGQERRIRHEPLLSIALGVALCLVLFFETQGSVYRATWAMVRSLPLVAALAGMAMISSKRSTHSNRSRAHVFLLLTMSGMIALVQFPYATPTYFYYVAPLAILALLAIVAGQPAAPRRMHFVVALFLLLFAVLFTNRTYGWNLGVQFIAYTPDSRLELARGGITVPRDDAATYEALVSEIQAHAEGGTIYAAPDCPEVYFLSGYPNPSRTIFDFLSRDPQDVAWMSALLDRAPIRVVVINTTPEVSPPLDAAVVAMLEQRFTEAKRIGKFTVRWRS